MPESNDFDKALTCRVMLGLLLLSCWVGYGFVVQQNPHFPSYWFAPLLGFFGLVDSSSWNNSAMWEEIMLPWLMFWLSVLLPIVLPSRVILKLFRR